MIPCSKCIVRPMCVEQCRKQRYFVNLIHAWIGSIGLGVLILSCAFFTIYSIHKGFANLLDIIIFLACAKVGLFLMFGNFKIASFITRGCPQR